MKDASGALAPGTLITENRTDAFAIWPGNWKLIYHGKAHVAGVNEFELYDRRTDAAEKNSLAASRPEVVNQLMTEIRQWIRTQDEVRKLLGPSGKVELDQQSIERLRSLGYLGGK